MPALRKVLESYARGASSLEALRTHIGRLARRAPEVAPNILAVLGGAYEQERLGPRELALLKGHLNESLLARPEEDHEADTVPGAANGPWEQPPPGGVTRTTPSAGGASAPATPPRPGRVASAGRTAVGQLIKDRFQLLEVLGAGGMGTVYKALDLLRQEARDRNPYVALKVMNEDFRRHPDAFLALQREASRQQRLAHPNIATVHDFDRTADGMVFIVMELLEGTTLKRYIRSEVRPRGGLPFDRAWPMIERMGQALAYAHAHGVVHSDFKPGNCFLTRGGSIKVLDFGMARAVRHPLLGEGERTLFDPGRLGALTPAYASVEMLEGKEPDPRDDVYALGCVAYELITGRHPFDKVPASRARALGRRPPPLPGLSQQQSRALLRALSFRRERRTASVEDFLAELSGQQWWSRHWPAASALALVALLGVVAATSLPEQFSERRAARVASWLLASSVESLPERLEELRALPPAQRKRVVERTRDHLTGYYEHTAVMLFSPDEGLYDYQGALQVLQQAQELIPDSAALQRAVDRLGAERERWLAAVERRVQRVLEAEADLPEAGAGLAGLLAHARRVDPGSRLGRDGRLAAAYARQAEAALDRGELNRASALVEGGLAIAEADAQLRRLAVRVTGARDSRERERTVVNLSARLQAGAPGGRTLQLALAELPLLRELSRLDPTHPALQGLGAELRPQVQAALEQFIARKDYAGAQAWVAKFAGLFETLDFSQEAVRLERARARHESERDELLLRLHGALAAADGAAPAQAAEFARALDGLGTEDREVRRARDTLARALLTSARRARADGQAATAAERLATAAALALSPELSARLRTEGYGRDSADPLALRSAVRELIDQTGEPAHLGSLSAAAEDLESSAPYDPLLVQLRESVARGLGAPAPGEPSEAALERVREGLALFPGIAALVDAHQRLQGEVQVQRELERRDRLREARDRLDALVYGSGVDSLDQEAAVASAMLGLRRLLPPEDPVIKEAESRVADLFLTRRDALLADQDYGQALALLDRALRIVPHHAGLGRALSQTVQLRDEARRRAQREAELAAVEDSKRLLREMLARGDVAQAQFVLAQLRTRLPPEDPLLREEVPRAFFELYGRLARERAAAGDYQRALDLGRAGLAMLPGAEDLATELSRWSMDLALERLERHFARALTLDTEQARADLALLATDPERFPQVRTRLLDILQSRLADMPEAEREQADALLAAGRALLPGAQLPPREERLRDLTNGPAAPVDAAPRAGS